MQPRQPIKVCNFNIILNFNVDSIFASHFNYYKLRLNDKFINKNKVLVIYFVISNQEAVEKKKNYNGYIGVQLEYKFHEIIENASFKINVYNTYPSLLTFSQNRSNVNFFF